MSIVVVPGYRIVQGWAEGGLSGYFFSGIAESYEVHLSRRVRTTGISLNLGPPQCVVAHHGISHKTQGSQHRRIGWRGREREMWVWEATEKILLSESQFTLSKSFPE